jgi:holliday junction DNA helicase RuvA
VIASVTGPVVALAPEQAVLEVGGIGLAVQCTPSTLATLRVGEHARLSTSMVVREDSLTLYGFLDDDERQVFELLQTASGVGPRLAQAALAVLGPDDLRRAVAREDLVTLTQVPGIGRKGAQRIVLELKDRLGAPGAGTVVLRGSSNPAAGQDGWRGQVHTALLGLGWSAREADEAVAAVAVDLDPGDSSDVDAPSTSPDVAVLLRQALQTLSKG